MPRAAANGSDLWSPEDDQPFTLDDDEDEPFPASPSERSSLSGRSTFGPASLGHTLSHSASAQVGAQQLTRRGSCCAAKPVQPCGFKPHIHC